MTHLTTYFVDCKFTLYIENSQDWLHSLTSGLAHFILYNLHFHS